MGHTQLLWETSARPSPPHRKELNLVSYRCALISSSSGKHWQWKPCAIVGILPPLWEDKLMVRPPDVCLRWRGKSSHWLWWTLVCVSCHAATRGKNQVLEEVMFDVHIPSVIAHYGMQNKVSWMILPWCGHFFYRILGDTLVKGQADPVNALLALWTAPRGAGESVPGVQL